ncbi:2-amino-4-hydroxy-6-hydroxymethyldihydropteridine pyrophosphokinase [Robbsia andropogonis]|uniref:2-amino-4-hydroxy-6-hydroxymethyldihydropteridine pyrophosphokinase n=1 Tax=Robbsia andropogonis TaxID=28092 RepID=A0A0F5JZP3_9BURK|nr:2-amino-4-hydroxy-6-hydroxymethyldihydropteridine diphosphokinase [Robbsia andropogonis]KKB63074.1 2-amino-4-hydroxy-6-hydroxymethyldihydropteridine pyrophosphokinase [Robbsia andropogonis]MCP1118394.1 2-amino-4-hydroxy-6-hydroxymethyldihydropteridine diphosphokinase [Robbsia andropogonis]MCP1127827.1 2-amino-4-hydroxy-6-hydroxymethyldihydropteridine diphosphokinase [Robbsia andropogonis]
MTVAYLGLGANLGDARQSLKDAVIALAQRPGIIVLGKSSLYRSAPIDASGGDYLNLVVAIGTLLPPRFLLELCQGIEHEFGRERPYHNAPRTLDVDILLYGDVCLDEPDLAIPHPRLTERAFALQPLLELDGDVVVPGKGRAADFLAAVSDQRIDIVATCQCRIPSASLCSPPDPV